MKFLMIPALFALAAAGCQSNATSSLNDTASTAAPSSFKDGDAFTCSDDVSGQVATLKIVRTEQDAEWAHVTVRSPSGERFYPGQSVYFSETEDGASFYVNRNDGSPVEYVVHRDVLGGAEGTGLVTDGGDSRGLVCSKLKGPSASALSLDAVIDVIERANAKEFGNTENFVLETRRYHAAVGSRLTTAGAVKDALANCTFTDQGMSEEAASRRSAHWAWKDLREAMNAGALEVFRIDDSSTVTFDTGLVLSDSCAVAGPRCAVFLRPTDGDEFGLFVKGDSCQ